MDIIEKINIASITVWTISLSIIALVLFLIFSKNENKILIYNILEPLSKIFAALFVPLIVAIIGHNAQLKITSIDENLKWKNHSSRI